MSTRWMKTDIDYLKNNYAKMSFKELSAKLNRTEGAIRAKCFDLKLIKNTRWSDSEIAFITKNYSKFTNKELANKLGRTESAIAMQLKKRSLHREQKKFNREYFRAITSKEKAYWLGFIFADGWIELRDGIHGTIGIELQRGDLSHLKKFNKALSGNVEVKTRERQCRYIKGRYVESTQTCYIKLHSLNMALDLKKYGVVQNKTKLLKAPSYIPNKYMADFIRGYFDGNGCISTTNHKNGHRYIKCDFSCYSIEFLSWIRENLNSKGIKSYLCENESCNRLFIGGLQNVNNFINFIYSNATVFLDRKYYKTKFLYKSLHISEQLPLCPEMDILN